MCVCVEEGLLRSRRKPGGTIKPAHTLNGGHCQRAAGEGVDL